MKDVAEISDELANKLFQQQKKPKNTPKLVAGKKNTVYKKHGKLVNNNTAGAIPYTVDTLSEDKLEAKAAFKKRLREIRENARIEKKIELENARKQKEAEESLLQGSHLSPVYSVPSNLNSPTDSLCNTIVSPGAPENLDSSTDQNNNTPRGSPKKTAAGGISGGNSGTASSSALPPVSTLLTNPSGGKKTDSEFNSKRKISKKSAKFQ